MKRMDLIRHVESYGCLLLHEGGRHSVYYKFVSIAEDAGTKPAAYLAAATLMKSDAAKACLREVLAMLGGLKGYLERTGIR